MDVLLSIQHISWITNLKQRGLAEKAIRQSWPYRLQQIGSGKKAKFFFLSKLPDNVQQVWADWHEKKYHQAVHLEKTAVLRSALGAANPSLNLTVAEHKLEPQRLARIPKPTGLESALRAMYLPVRHSYYKPVSKRRHGKQNLVYDGVSMGLCAEARQIFKRRFGDWLELGQTAHEPKTEQAPRLNDYLDLSSPSLLQHKFFEDFLKHFHLQKFKEIHLMTVNGNAMEPLLHAGDQVLVDRQDKYLSDGAVYLLLWNGDLCFRKVQRLKNGMALTGSYQGYDDTVIVPQNLNTLQIFGRAVARMGCHWL